MSDKSDYNFQYLWDFASYVIGKFFVFRFDSTSNDII